MDEIEARFTLLQKELESIQQGIRSFDTAMFQIKAWCVTVAVAAGGFAVSSDHPALVGVAVAATGAFWLLDAHDKALQRTLIRRDLAIEDALSAGTVQEAFESGRLTVPQMASGFSAEHHPVPSRWAYLTREVRLVWREARMPLTFNLYLYVTLCLGLEALLI